MIISVNKLLRGDACYLEVMSVQDERDKLELLDKDSDSEKSISQDESSSLKTYLASEQAEARRYWAKRKALRSSMRSLESPRISGMFTLKNIAEKDESRSSDVEDEEDDENLKEGWATADAEARRYWHKRSTRHSAMGALEFPRGMYSNLGNRRGKKEEYSPALVNPLFKLKVLDNPIPKETPARSARWVKVGSQWVKTEDKENQETSGEKLEDQGSVADAYVSSPTRTAKITAKWKVTKRRSSPMRSTRPKPKDRKSATF